MNSFVVPDTDLAREALRMANDHVSDAILAHSLRAFYIGLEYGRARTVPVDIEALFIATILHDLGFREPFDPKTSFEIVGANAARSLLASHDDPRADLIWDAIAMHTVPHLAREGPAEVLLTHLGSSTDAFGIASARLDDAFLHDLHEHYPRGDLQTELAGIMDRHAAVQPFGQLAAFRALGLRPV